MKELNIPFIDIQKNVFDIDDNPISFFAKRGESYHYIPCLNDNPEHIEMMSYLIGKHTQGWKV